jgi:hypothetical protein
MSEFNFTEGSVKQIEWATKIRAEAHAKMQKEVEEANARVNRDNMPNYWLWCVQDAADFISGFIDIKIGTDAGNWIEKRNHVGGYANDVNERAGKRYQAIYDIYGYQAISQEQYNDAMEQFKNRGAK